jgi:hypothetical protein
LVVLASFYAAFIVSVLEKYYAPLIRGGTETYDIHVHAYNVLYDHSISYSFLPGDLEQDVDHPHAFAQDVHVRAAFSQRFVGAAVLLLGFVDVHTFLLILCLGFCATFIGVVFQLSADHGYLRSSRGYPIAGVLVLLYTLCDKKRAGHASEAMFFIIWQSELVFASFCSTAFTFALCLAEGVRKSWKAVVAAAIGSCASVSLFIFQLLSYRGLSVFSEIISTMGERTELSGAAVLFVPEPTGLRDGPARASAARRRAHRAGDVIFPCPACAAILMIGVAR